MLALASQSSQGYTGLIDREQRLPSMKRRGSARPAGAAFKHALLNLNSDQPDKLEGATPSHICERDRS